MESSYIIEIIEGSFAFCAIHPCFIYQKATRRRHDRKERYYPLPTTHLYYGLIRLMGDKAAYASINLKAPLKSSFNILMPNGRKISENIPHSNLIASINQAMHFLTLKGPFFFFAL
ncbi:hypothetical protein CEXT_258781 [Caerostris extrusa]|uniref:Uncharacterized protein n=1 Tax=Caerostris extrusa TaxID=172846 RepID=A0AAV4XFD8_CAEEX|nr:hypothetical protein CEXT_258781 [Caerostris extrusa]